ncbi:UNVERIFIED_CONTAM: hypothetical protein ABID98_002822 [Brevibacillus sp. OAP136]
MVKTWKSTVEWFKTLNKGYEVLQNKRHQLMIKG